VDALSGGQAQRVRFAVAMAGRPDLLSWTNPRWPWTSGPVGGSAVGEGGGNTVVFATHYLDEATSTPTA